ncbi:MAG: methyltransferase domain-containing protein [Alphaproteobacteria bacterium]
MNILREQLDKDFSDFGKRPSLGTDTLIRDFMFECFRPYLPTSPQGRAVAVGLQNARESALIAQHYESQLILNASGGILESLALDTPHYTFELAFGSPEKLTEHGRFDGVFSIHTFNFVERPDVILTKMRESLNEGGKLFLGVQNATAGTRQMALSMGFINHLQDVPPAMQRRGQLRFMDLEMLQDIIKEAGFRKLDTGGILLKTLTEAQTGALLAQGLVGEPYLRALFELGRRYPELCASVYVVAEKI